MKLQCYLTEGRDIDIQPAPRKREWMDETSEAFAYRCLPLTIANSHGWEIRSPVTVEFEWNGGNMPHDMKLHVEGPGGFVSGHVGNGIVTFTPNVIFRTPPGYNLLVTGPVNTFRDGIQPISGVVESDWIPYPFTMNWKFTRPGRIRFEKGEPYCFFFPLKRGLLEEFEPEILDIAEDPELKRHYEYARNRRAFKTGLKLLGATVPEGNEPKDLHFQRWYLQGTYPDQKTTFDDHQKVIGLKPFRRPEDP